MSYDGAEVLNFCLEKKYSAVEGDNYNVRLSNDHELTKEEKTNLCQAFTLLDEDGDGVIEPQELKKLLISWGRMDIGEDLQNFMKYSGAKGCEGAVGMDFNGLRRFMEKELSRTSDENELREAFEVFDSNPLTGKLNVKELRHYLKKQKPQLSDDEIDFLFREEDYWMLEEKDMFEYEELINKIMGKPFKSNFLKIPDDEFKRK